MRYRILFLWVSLLLVFSHSARPSQAQSDQAWALQVLESDAQHLLLELIMPSFDIKTISHDGVSYQRLAVEADKRHPQQQPAVGSWSRWGQPGQPQLPMLSLPVGMPWPGAPQVSVLEMESDQLGGYRLYPNPDLVPGGEADAPEIVEAFALDTVAYNTDTLYPGPLVEVAEPGLLRDQPLFQLRLYPFQYNPSRQELQVYRRLKILITFPPPPQTEKQAPAAPIPASFQKLLENTLLNYEALPAPGSVSDQPTPKGATTLPSNATYVIITHPDFYNAVQGLATYRASQGESVAVVKTDDIYAQYSAGVKSADAIHDFLVDAYATWSTKPVYVVLIGDADDGAITVDPDDPYVIIAYDPDHPADYLPAHYEPVTAFGVAPLDAWFAKVHGDDIYPDLLVGRIPARSVQDVTTVINKVIAYEQTPAGGSWLRKAVLVADDKESHFQADMDTVADLLPASVSPTKLYKNSASTSVPNKIGSGALIFAYSGHGSARNWGNWSGDNGPIYRSTDIAQMWNNNKLPFLTVANCLNGLFTYRPRVLAEEFLLLANKGGIASWAPASYAFPSVNTPIAEKLYQTLFVEHDRLLGSAVTTARIEAYLDYPHFPLPLFESFTFFGDPAVRLNLPATLTLNGSANPEAPDSVVMGAEVTYALTYTVSEADVAPGLTLENTLPRHVTYQSASPPPTTINGRTLIWNLGDVPAGNGSVTIVARVDTGGLTHGEIIQNQSELFDATGGNQVLTLETTVDDRPISSLSASNTSPTELGSKTTLSAAVSAGTNVVYTWNFGDGSGLKTGPSVQHTYSAVGTYTAQVTASNGVGSQSKTTTVTLVDVPPQANFISSTPDRTDQISTFQSTSGGTNLSYAWDFGDGGSSTDQHPSHNYTTVGTYNVTLTVSNSAGSDSITIPIAIIPAVELPVAGFTSTTPDELSQITLFTNTSDDGGEDTAKISYAWDFGDGGSSTDQHPSHTYGAVGTYNVQLTIANTKGSNTFNASVVIVDMPISGLTFSSNSPTSMGQNMAFSANIAAGSNSAYTWNFGDGTPTQSGGAVQHSYAAIGTYLVQVTAVNSVSSETVTGTVTVIDVPLSGLTVNNNSPTLLGAQTTLSAGTSAGTNVVYTWQLGDESPPQTSPSLGYTYPAIGTYLAQVTASNGVSSQTQTTTVTINDLPPQAMFTTSTPDVVGQTTTFQNVSTGTNLVYDWVFGDGGISNTDQPTHIYTLAGTYGITLTVSNSAGSSAYYDTVVITDVPISGLAMTSNSPLKLGNETILSANVVAGSNVTYTWDLGDGSPFQQGTSIQHVYSRLGTYQVRLTAANSAGSQTVEETVVIVDVPISGLTATTDSPTELGKRTTLSAQVISGSNVIYTWDLGDGSPPRTGPSVQQTYLAVGAYQVRLTAANSVSSQTIDLSPEAVVIVDVPISGLTATTDSPTELGSLTTLSAQVTSGSNILYTWDFGDNAYLPEPGNYVPETGVSLTHIYPTRGVYTAQVTASNGVSSYSEATTVSIVDVPPQASFFSSTPDQVGQTTTFQSISAGSDLTYLWDFGDGSLPVSGQTDIMTYTYATTGTYTVHLTITNSAGSSTTSGLVELLDRVQEPVASFISTTPDELGQATAFTNISQDGADEAQNISYAWHFGDGTTSSDKHPTHTYSALGSYTVGLIISNSLASDIYSDTVSITDVSISGLTVSGASFIWLDGPLTLSATVQHGTNVVYTWDFGDGSPLQTGPVPSVEHIYADVGHYTVHLTATNGNNNQTETLLVEITDAPVSGLTMTVAGAAQLGQVITLSVTATSGTNMIYTWDFGDGSSLQTGPAPSVEHIYANPGHYTVHITATNGSSSQTETLPVVITDIPLSGLTVTAAGAAQIGGGMTLSVAATSGTNVIYTWDFGDGSPPQTGPAPSVEHIYANPGHYTIQVTATNSSGSSVETLTIEIGDGRPPLIFLPLIFR